jgi:formyl-CoA transferase/succinyl-CoA--D-citramalate CoA-transferase
LSDDYGQEAMTPSATGPLAGIRVLELGSFIAGPFAGQLLADYGADVIKVEPPGEGDPMRRWGTCIDGRSLTWPTIARNKRSVAIDLRRPEGVALVKQLAASCDVVLENFRPGRLAEWGMAYEDLRSLNPRVVVVHVSGFGQSGPRSTEPGFGSIAEAMGGIRYTTGDSDRPSTRTGVSLGDSLAGLFAVIGTLAALVARSNDDAGTGEEVDVAIYEAVMAIMEASMAEFEVAGVLRERTGPVLPGVAPSNAYLTADGHEVLIAANADPIYRRLCSAMQCPELADDPRYATHLARADHQTQLDETIGVWTRTLTRSELVSLCQEFEIPVGEINSAADVLRDPHVAARGMIERVEAGFVRPVPMTQVVPRFGSGGARIRHPGPSLGADTHDVLAEIGLSDEAIGTLRETGSVQ